MANAKKAKASQEFVPVREVRDGVLVLEDGSLRAVLMASSLNFALKSSDEQMAILSQFQNFLNSLDFSVQFVAHSRDLDIRPYIALLEERENEQENEMMKIQTREYISFVKAFTENANIMTKTFFAVVPYSASIVQSQGGVSGGLRGLLGKKGAEEKKAQKTERFEESRTQLEQRIAVVEQGLSRTGIRVVQLGSEELIELFYKIFNPGDLEKPIPFESK